MAVDRELARLTLKDLEANDEVHFAYHVTNMRSSQDPPPWTELRWHRAGDCDFDGKILCGTPCVFFTITTWRRGLPDFSPYPRNGKRGQYYWRVKIPLKEFDDYKHIIFIHKYGVQVQLLLATKTQVNGIKPAILKAREKEARKYFRRERRASGGYNYYSREYDSKISDSERCFVNFAVCENFTLTRPVWTVVVRGHHGTGNLVPNPSERNEDMRSTWFEEFKTRLNEAQDKGLDSPKATSRKRTERIAETTSEDDAKDRVHYAYHVTNMPSSEKPPSWEKLLWHLADKSHCDIGSLSNAPCVFFTTTTQGQDLPPLSPYPLHGTDDQHYWCVKIPINAFCLYRHIIFIQEDQHDVQLLMATYQQVKGIDRNVLEERENKARQYLRRVPKYLDKYYSNRDETKCVNFAVCDDVHLDDCVWTVVKRNRDEPANLTKREMIKSSFLAEFKSRLNEAPPQVPIG